MTDLRESVGQAIGAATMCWKDIDEAGVFEAEKAAGIVNELVAWIEAHYEPKSDESDVLESSPSVWVDSLTHDERLRLECLALATQSMANPALSFHHKVIERSAVFESYVREGRVSRTTVYNYDETGRLLTNDEVKERLQAEMQTPENARREIYENEFGVTDYPAAEGGEAVNLEG